MNKLFEAGANAPASNHGKSFFQVAPAEAKFLYNKNKSSLSPAFRKKSFFTAFAQLQSLDSRRGPGGDRKAPWSPPQRRNPLQNESSLSPVFRKKSLF